MIKLNEIKEMMKLYFPIMGQDFVESTLFVMLITAIVTRLDTYSIAVYNLLEVVSSVIILPAYSYGGVAMALVSQNFKNQSNTELNQYPKTAVMCSLFIILTLTGIIFIFPDILGIITDDSKLLTEAYGICIFALLIQLINAVSQVYKYTLQSIGYETWILKYSTIISLLSCIVIYFAISVFELGLVGLYIGMGLMYFMLAAGYTGKTIMG
jgi:MATE efflux family protein